MSQQDPSSVPQSTDPEGAAAAGSLDALLEVSMPVIVEIGRTTMTLQEVLHLGPGSVVQLERAIGEPVDLYVGDRRLAQGEIVVVDDQLGVRITRVLPAQGLEAAA